MIPRHLLPLLLSAAMIGACGGTATPADASAASGAATATAPAGDAQVTQADATAQAVPPSANAQILPLLTVHKTPSCGCCTLWVEHMREAGFTVSEVVEDDLGPVKQRLGVPYAKGSCHTAEVGGYLVEGHVPADDVKRLLMEQPDARGLVLPGMPMGSPGMESPDGRVQPYTVELVRRDGSVEPFSHHLQR